MSYAMTVAEQEAFLAAPRIGVLSIARDGRGPLAAPVWYDYEAGGGLWFLTQNYSLKGKLLTVGNRITMTVQTETAPYSYVSVEGPVTTIEAYDFDVDLLPMACRYLGDAGGAAYVENAKAVKRDRPASETSIKVNMQLEQWLSVDYAKRG